MKCLNSSAIVKLYEGLLPTCYLYIVYTNGQRIDTRFVVNGADNSDEEIEIEIIEVEEPEEPVPMMDSCLQVCTLYYIFQFRQRALNPASYTSCEVAKSSKLPLLRFRTVVFGTHV